MIAPDRRSALRFMESSVFLSDLLTAHERKMRKRLEIKERIFRFMGRATVRVRIPKPRGDCSLPL